MYTSQAPWKSGKVIALLIVGVLLVACYPLWATKHPEPLIPPVLFSKNPRVLTLSLAVREQRWVLIYPETKRKFLGQKIIFFCGA
jgi:CHASE2 domain-containing sensor protein